MTSQWMRRRWVKRRSHSGPTPFVLRPIGLFLMFLLAIAVTTVAVIGTTAATAYATYNYFARDLPGPEAMANREIAASTLIYDRKGRLLYEVFDQQYGRRQYVSLNDVSPYLIQATVATEDADFYTNSGINYRGLMRAAMVTTLGTEDATVQGGSSITQQLVKNVIIPEEERSQRLVTRKIKEMILATALTERYSKDQILEWYLNENNYGNLSYGIEAAAQSYFDKSARDLTLAEASMLAGIPQAPGSQSPMVNKDRAKARQYEVLDLMVRHGYITREAADEAWATELEYKTAKFTIEAPHFVFYVRDQLIERYGHRMLSRGGLRVTTSLDLDFQNQAQELVRQHVEVNGPRFGANNAASVSIDPRTGEILSMVGSIDYFEPKNQGQVNMIVSERQPGSSFKPITYLTTFLKGWAPATIVEDTPMNYVDDLGRLWTPVNVDKTFRGPVPIRTALANSMNLPAVRAILYAGVDATLDMAHRMGITTLNRKGWYGPSLTLGGGEVRPLDIAFAYTVFANNGKLYGRALPPERQRGGFAELEPVSVLKVEDANGNVLEEFTQPEERVVVEAPYAYLVTNILTDNNARSLVFGPNSALILPDRPVAAKSGTTDDNRDNWTIGFTPELVTAVWVGNTDNTKMYTSALSSNNAGPLWQSIMKTYHAGREVMQFTRPPGVVTASVCASSGLLVSSGCGSARTEVFVAGKLPARHRESQTITIKIDRTTGRPATADTPPENIEERVHVQASDDLRQKFPTSALPPMAEVAPGYLDRVRITSPAQGATVRGSVAVFGSANAENFAGYTLEAGDGLSPAGWQAIGGGDRPVDGGQLGRLDLGALGPVVSLRLTVHDRVKGPQIVRTVVTQDGYQPPAPVAQSQAAVPAADWQPPAPRSR